MVRVPSSNNDTKRNDSFHSYNARSRRSSYQDKPAAAAAGVIVPRGLYNCVQTALASRKERETKRDKPSELKLKHDESRVKDLANMLKHTVQLPLTWKYNPVTANTLVPSDEQLPTIIRFDEKEEEEEEGLSKWTRQATFGIGMGGVDQIHGRAMKEAYVTSINHSLPAKNMRKTDLGTVIFGCKHITIGECLSKQLFGLPQGHYSYIKNISKGLVLFLFNYSDRTLHGINEAAGPGQMNIDRYAWVEDGDESGYTIYPAQFQIRVRQECQPLSEDQFGPIISNNYYESKHFHFELDHDQTIKLILLFKSKLVISGASFNQIPTMWNNLHTSLPVPSKRLEYNAIQNWQAEVGFDHFPLPPGMAKAGNMNQSSKLSYASVLSKCHASTIF